MRFVNDKLLATPAVEFCVDVSTFGVSSGDLLLLFLTKHTNIPPLKYTTQTSVPLGTFLSLSSSRHRICNIVFNIAVDIS
jgi:hypothetical protein